MKQDLLETLIKQVLFEQRTVAKIRNASAKMTAEARNAGAVHAYAVLVKGTSNPRDIQDLVEAATNASVGGDTETVAVGKNSKFGNGNYMYVCSTPKSDKRQLINVWIAPTSVIQSLPDHERPIEGEEQAKQGFTKIGNSVMLTKLQLSQFKNLDIIGGNTGFNILSTEAYAGSSEIDDKDLVKEPDVKKDDNKKDDVKKDDNTEWLNKNVTKNVTFPYTWHTFDKRNNPIQLTVFDASVLDDKRYLYTKINGEWLVIKEPERFISTIEKEQKDPDSVSWNELWSGMILTPADQAKLDAILEAISLNRYKPTLYGNYTEYILSPKIEGYPYDSYGDAAGYWQNTKDFDTLSDSDPYVYMFDDYGPTHYMLKSDFETYYADYKKLNALLQPLTDQSVIDKVNKHYNNDDSTETKPKPTTTVKPKPPVKTDPNKTKVIKLNTEKTESRNGIVFINLSKTPVYNYKNKKWVKVGDYDPKDGQYIAYLGNSSDYKYVRVQFAKDQVTAWVPTSAVK